MNRIILIYFLVSNFCFSLDRNSMNFAPDIEFPENEKKMVVIVPSYNNESFYKENLDSIFSQEYSNFRIIYANDASTDDTGKLVQEYVKYLASPIKFTYLSIGENGGPLSSIYKMVYLCEDDEIVVIVDGDDKFLHNGVLGRLNRAYADDHVWMTYGSYFSILGQDSTNKPMKMRDLKLGLHRKYSFSWSHPKTFFAGLFKQIPTHKLKENNKFFESAGDVPLALFLLDLSREHTYYIPDLLYDYNTKNPISEHRVPNCQGNEIARRVWALPHLRKLNSRNEFMQGIYLTR